MVERPSPPARATNRSSPEVGNTAAADAALAAALAAIVLPAPSAEEHTSLKRSIQARGVLVSAVVSTGPACTGEVADGEARLEISAELGIDCPVEQRPFQTETEFRLFRLTANVTRRQLSDAAKIRIGLALEPGERARSAARKAQAKGQRRGDKSLPVELPEEKGETRERIASAVGLKPSTYARGAKVLTEGSAELVAALEERRESVNSAWRKLRAEKRRRETLTLAERLDHDPPPLPANRFPVLVLDPPWPYPQGSLPYPTMTLEAIADIPIPDLLTEDGLVWLWTTNRFLFEAAEIARERWQLHYRNLLTWGKDRAGTGAWLRGQSEHCLLYTRGKPVFVRGNESTLLVAPVREHSRKPDDFYALVERTCPGPKLELFARERRPGWQAWGAEPDRYTTTEKGDAAA